MVVDDYQLILPQPYHAIATEDVEIYYHAYQDELQLSEQTVGERLLAVKRDIQQTQTYHQTYEELVIGARLAWRNATRCIGRLNWQLLQMRDMRHLTSANDIFQELLEHIQLSTNAGKIRPIVTVFAPQRPGQPGLRILE